MWFVLRHDLGQYMPDLAVETALKRLALALLCCAGMAQAEPYGQNITPFDFIGFHSIEVRNDVHLNVNVAETERVVVNHTRADLDQFIVQQFGEWLRLDRNKRWFIWTNGRQDRFVAYADMPQVRELKALSGAVIRADLGTQDQFRAEAENGKITVSVDTPSLRLRGNDGADITVTGTCGRLTMLARPTSTVNLSELDCDSIVIFGDTSRVTLRPDAQVVDKHPEAD